MKINIRIIEKIIAWFGLTLGFILLIRSIRVNNYSDIRFYSFTILCWILVLFIFYYIKPRN